MTSPTPAPRTEGLSPKAVAAAVVAFLLTVALPAAEAVVAHLADNPELLSAVPAWLRVGALAALVALGTLLAACRARPGVVTTPGLTRGYGDL